ncbi:MAG: TA system VapC family ribonuclease toxin [bacterium]
MLCLDVNVLVHAFVRASPSHERCATWLESALQDRQAMALPLATLSGFVRIVTSRLVFPTPSTPDRATEFTDWLLAHPRTLIPPTNQSVYDISRDLIREHGLSGNDVPDAFLAATALHLGATLVTADRGFRRFGSPAVLDPCS